MKDCSSCKNNVTTRPELMQADFDDTPCSKCRAREPERYVNLGRGEIGVMVSYGNQFENPSSQTWGIMNIPKEEHKMQTFKYWLDAWTKIERPDQIIIALIVRNPSVSQSELARKSGVSRQMVHKNVKRLRERFPGVFV